MSLASLIKGAKIIETIDNYALADNLNASHEGHSTDRSYQFYDDEEFWRNVITNPAKYWNQRITLYDFVISEWVARVPGLFWSPTSEAIRLHNREDVAIQNAQWIEFNPPGKSKKVVGGIGTLLLPPTEDGKVLLSASSNYDASLGVPLLCFPEVYEHLKIRQGDIVIVRNAKWQPMDFRWASKFISKDIPRGYLVIDSIEKIEIYNRDHPVIYHPFSLMEYENQDGLFYDFVYITADSKVKNVDIKIKTFFDTYARKDSRNGKYLLNPNMVSPIFESRYSAPSELIKVSHEANINLLYERIRGTYFNGQSIEQLIVKLPQYYNSIASVRTLARNIGLNVSLLEEGSPVNMCAQVISFCINRNIVEALIDRAMVDHPEIFI